MTGIANDITNTPRYQRMIQKFTTLRPEQRAILNTAILDEKFADEAMRKQLQALATASALENKGKALDLSGKALDLKKQAIGLRTSLYKDTKDFARDQDRLGNIISMANVPLAGYLGYQKMKTDADEAEEMGKFRRGILNRSYGG